MKIVAVLLAILWIVDGLRLRARLGRLGVLGESGDGEATEEEGAVAHDDAATAADPIFLAAPGCEVSDAVRAAAAANARATGLEVQDLVPADLPVERLLGFLQLADPAVQRNDPFIPGRTAGAAFAVDPEVARRAGAEAPADPVAMIRLGVRLKHFAARTTAHVIAPGLRAPKVPGRALRAVLNESLGAAAPFFLAIQIALFALLAAACAFDPFWGLGALAVFHLQPVLVVAGTRARPRDLLLTLIVRAPRGVVDWVRTVAAPPRLGEDPVEARRPVYATLLEGGTDRFYEPRLEACPLCGGKDLSVELLTTDLLQFKPGRFELDRCGGCGHVFQNPRLSLEGLDFYYKDFYDGLGAAGLDGVFGFSAPLYEARGDLVATAGEPRRWLDVGTGHGHLPLAMKARWPDTRFEGLDLSESVEEAEARRWIDQGHRGLFPELADDLAGRFDVVSMSHYLEHTLSPEAEVQAAAKVLEPGGRLFIEVPDPDCVIRRRLGRYWLPYFQPQHLNLVPAKVLGRILEDSGFEVLAWHRGEAHQPVDWLGAAVMWLGRLAPGPARPWRPKRAGQGLLRAIVWTTLGWVVPLSIVVDKATAEGKRREGRSNTYRVLARRVG